MSRILVLRFVWGLLLLSLYLLFGVVTVGAQAQATAGQIIGTVKDPGGAVVPNASVIVSNPDIGFSQTYTTNGEGEFRALALRPGNYMVEVTASGFGKFTQTGYHVEVGSSLSASVNLAVEAVTEEVSVTAASVEVTETTMSTNINDVSIAQLPINGRRFQDFVLGTPSAQIDPARGQISLVGQRGINGNVQLDGADYNNPFFGGLRGGERSNQAFTIPQGAIKEFQVVASGYTAEFGRSTGGVVNAVTKSGTNNFHGGAFYVDRPRNSAALNAFRQVAAPTQQQFGGDVGGPLIKDKLFFFGAYEQQQLEQKRAVLFNNLHVPEVDPTSVSGITEALNYSLGTEGPYRQTNNAKVILTRADYNITAKNQLTARYNHSVNTALNAVTAGTSLTPTTNSAVSDNGTEGDDSNTGVAQLTSFFSPVLLNEARFQYSRENRPRLANVEAPLLGASYGNFGTVSFLPTTETDYRTQFTDNVTKTTSLHTIKMGGEFNYAKASQFFQFRQFGNFFFSGIGTDPTSVIQVLRILSAGGNSTTANANGNIVGAVDPTNRFDDTRVRYSRNVGNGLASMPSPQFSGFIQDAWRVRPNLTVNLGLRYEAQLMPTPDTSNSALLSAVTNANLPLTTPKPTVIPDQTKQWAPRIGFAWTPGNSTKTVVRGFSGIYYAATPLLTLAAPLNNLRTPPGDLTVQLPTTNLPASLNTVYKQFQSIGIDLNTTTLDKLPILTLDQFNKIISNITQAGGAAPNPLSGLQIVTMGSKFANPRSTQFGGGVEHEVMRGFTVGANFDYVNTVHLNYNLDIDLPTPIIRPGDKSERPFFGIVSSTVIGAQHRPITQLGDSGYVQVRDPGARSLYRGFTVRGQLRRKWGQFDAFYTLAKDLDTDSTERNATFASYDNAYNLKPEYNYSAIDRRHQLAFNTVLHAPFGFQFAVFGRYLSGAPIDASVSSIVAPTGSGLTAAQYATQVTLQGSTTGDLNQDAGNFNDRPYTAPGVSMKRNAFRNEHLLFNDLRIQREFRFEKVTFSPSFEVFNALNLKNINLGSTTATNYGNPGINENTGAVLGPSNPTFLKLRDANGNLLLTNSPGAPRQLQFGIRFQF